MRVAALIVDTSALVAIAKGEDGWEQLRDAIDSGPAVIPAPALTEFHLVMAGRLPDVRDAAPLIDVMLAKGVTIASFEERHAAITRKARELYGRRNGSGGLLNFGDLMVYAVAKQRGEPVLCAGRDFASTDLTIHPASRLDP